MTFVARTVKPEPAVALAVPLAAIAGMQPSEFVFAVQYTVPAQKGSYRRIAPPPEARISTQTDPGCDGGTSHWPHMLKPQANNAPLASRAKVCHAPAAT